MGQGCPRLAQFEMNKHKRRRRILCLVSKFWFNTGAGGHYYSALAVAASLSEFHDVELLSLGDERPAALCSSDVAAEHLTVSLGLGASRSFAKEMGKRRAPDAIIAFDWMSGIISRTYCVRNAVGLLQVKAGGPWSRRYFPRNSVQVHFSLKDHRKAQKRSKRSFWIPNRVPPAITDRSDDAIWLRERLDIGEDETVIIRIGRIAEVYRPAFLGALELRRQFTRMGASARLVMIGHPESEPLAEELRSKCEKGLDYLLTDPETTRSAARFLPVATVNVGVGRGFMEGCALGQFMFAMGHESGLPTFCNDENISAFLLENFSMRVRVDCSERDREQHIAQVLQRISGGQTSDPTSRRWFTRWFSNENLGPLYTEAVEAAISEPEKRTLDYYLSQFWLGISPLEYHLRGAVSSRMDVK